MQKTQACQISFQSHVRGNMFFTSGNTIIKSLWLCALCPQRPHVEHSCGHASPVGQAMRRRTAMRPDIMIGDCNVFLTLSTEN